MTKTHHNVSLGLFFLRLGLGIYLILLAGQKLFAPLLMIVPMEDFYGLHISASLVMIIGAIELSLALFFILGIHRTLVYGVAFFLQLATFFLSLSDIGKPFLPNNFFVVSLPLLMAFLALFIARKQDIRWALGKKHMMFYND